MGLSNLINLNAMKLYIKYLFQRWRNILSYILLWNYSETFCHRTEQGKWKCCRHWCTLCDENQLRQLNSNAGVVVQSILYLTFNWILERTGSQGVIVQKQVLLIWTTGTNVPSWNCTSLFFKRTFNKGFQWSQVLKSSFDNKTTHLFY